jgi:general L-amino acid transport system permease protein
MLLVSAWPRLWTRRGAALLAVGWVLAFAVFFVLMLGGVFGLDHVGTERWGGLPLTVILTLIGMSASAPPGVLLALGRRSEMPLLRTLCTAYIELVRGVPFLTVLFVATFVFPLVLPPGWRIDPFWRIVIGMVLFQSAYMAETVRGGLQTLPRGQREAGISLGLGYWELQRSIVLPQALVAVIPSFVNNLLSTFMDTSLVTVVSMYDLTGALRLALGDPVWREFFIEGYLFIAAIYFGSSFAMSRYSQWLERRLTTGAAH